MTVYNAFFRAKLQPPDPEFPEGLPWPDIPVEVEGAVIVGFVGSSPKYIWHAVGADADGLSRLPNYMGDSYNAVQKHANGKDVLLAEVEEDDPDNPGQKRRRRMNMRNKPPTGVIEENVIPHLFAGIHA